MAHDSLFWEPNITVPNGRVNVWVGGGQPKVATAMARVAGASTGIWSHFTVEKDPEQSLTRAYAC